MEQRTLLIGNGINRLFQGEKVTWKEAMTRGKNISWEQLLAVVANRYGIALGNNSYTPSPLVFEKILNDKVGDNKHDERIKTLKKCIAQTIANGGVKANEFHKKIMEMEAYADILTTNYDYCLEESACPDFLKQRNNLAANKDEYAYSLKRCYSLPGKNIWHIHGELYNTRKPAGAHYLEESILIGFEQYCLYLEKIIENVKAKRNMPANHSTAEWIYKTLRQRIQDNGYKLNESPYWIDRFFASDMDIIGYSFDFSETHLWWLLSYRVRLMDEKLVDNSIRYFYPVIDGNVDTDSKDSAIRILLNSLHVECVPVPCSDHKDFYDKFIAGKYS